MFRLFKIYPMPRFTPLLITRTSSNFQHPHNTYTKSMHLRKKKKKHDLKIIYEKE